MKKFLVVAAWAIMVVILSGCTSSENDAITTTSTVAPAITSIVSTTEVATTTVVTTAEATTTTTAVATKPTPKQENIKGVRRAMLSKKLRKLYDAMYQKILRYEEFTVDTRSDAEYSAEEVYEVMNALREDYPEFWLYLSSYEGEDSVYDKETGEPIAINSIRVAYEYTWIIRNEFSSKEMKKILSQIDKVCDEVLSRMPTNGTLEEKYLFLAKEIADRTVYVSDRNFESNSDVDWSYCYMNGPFLAGEGLCQGYAMAYQYLCNRAGLWCICISGQGGGEPHSWNLVKTSNGTFHVDVTWCDSEGFENYFMISQEEILIDHTPDEGEPAATGK